MAKTGQRQRAREVVVFDDVRADLISSFDLQDDALYVWADFEYPKRMSKASASMTTVSEIGIVDHETGSTIMDLRESREQRQAFLDTPATIRSYMHERQKSRLVLGFYSTNGIDLAFMQHLISGMT